MNDQARLISSDLQPVDERDLTRIVQTRVESLGRRSVPPADKMQRPISPRRSYAPSGGELCRPAGASRCLRIADSALARIPPRAPPLGLA